MKHKTTYQLDYILSNRRMYPQNYINLVSNEYQKRRKAREIKAFVKNYKKN